MALAALFQEDRSRLLAYLIGVIGNIDLAEDCLQEAGIAALTHWPGSGIPDNPVGWILATARRKAIDQIRRDNTGARKAELLATIQSTADETTLKTIPDDRLRLIFTCCHPALAMEARIALTLRILGGMTTEAIARAFLVPEATLAQRIVRAKKKILSARIPYAEPAADALPERLEGVLATLYLIFNEGYSNPASTERDLAAEAIRLCETLLRLMPNEPEILGLLALMLLHDARRPARWTPAEDLVLLEDQDRTRWSAPEIQRGIDIVETALRLRRPGPYQLQAAIAAVHAEATVAADTDWRQIVGLYDSLLLFTPTPVVRLNRCAALALAEGPEAGLEALEQLADDDLEAMADYYLFHAARADLLRRLGSLEAASAAYQTALDLTTVPAQRRYLEKRLAELTAPATPQT